LPDVRFVESKNGLPPNELIDEAIRLSQRPEGRRRQGVHREMIIEAPEGVLRFNLEVDVKELAQWEPSYITAFFKALGDAQYASTAARAHLRAKSLAEGRPAAGMKEWASDS
jgi:hypothetical protein